MSDVDNQDFDPQQPEEKPVSYKGLGIIGVLLFIVIVLIISFQLVYANKIYPGVSANGVYLGGLTQSEAEAKLSKATTAYSTELLPISYNKTTLRIPLKQLNLSYDTKVSATAMEFGRKGTFWTKTHAQARALVGKSTPFSGFSFPSERLSPYLLQVTDDVDTTAQNATLTFNDNQAQVTPAQTGKRVDIGRLALLVESRLRNTSTEAVAVPVYELAPSVTTASLKAAASQADSFISAPVTLAVGETSRTIDQPTIISWLSVMPVSAETSYMPDFYPTMNDVEVKIELNKSAINTYVADIAKKTDQAPQNAALTITDDVATVFQPSRNGIKLDQSDATSQITKAITTTGENRALALKVVVSKPAISEENLNNLGIKELISTATTYFPGSPSARLTNVRVGASKYNGVLLAPGEQFSFGKLLGEVGPEQGYLPALVILGNREEKQYGGGLCQVSSTAYRAALLAGLTINERYNHSFAISYYTAPYGVPGLDATIYYPQVDMKFTNDTGSYILIQTRMKGTTLTFDYYGTKTKSGKIRGPFFVTGSNDETKPSSTVFYRDVLDLAGNVTKTDTVRTNYKSSLDFPIVKEYN